MAKGVFGIQKGEIINPNVKETGMKHPGWGNKSKTGQKQYTPKEFEKMLMAYFKEKDTELVTKLTNHGTVSGQIKNPYSLPGLANYLNMTTRCLHNYRFAETHKEYWDLMRYAVSMIEERMIEGGLHGYFNPRMVEFMLKNLRQDPEDYADKVEIEKRQQSFQRVDVHVINEKKDLKALESENLENKRALGIDIDAMKRVEGETIDIEAVQGD